MKRKVDNRRKTCTFIGAPLNLGQELRGVEMAPDSLREHGCIESIASLGWGVKDLGNVEMVSNISPLASPRSLSPSRMASLAKPTKREPLHAREIGISCRALSQVTQLESRDRDNFVITIGGDHSIALGSIHGILTSRPDTCVIWVDAHADINTPATSDSGHIHGMPVAALMGEFPASKLSAEGFGWLKARLNPKKIAYIGLRDIDEGEKEILQKHEIAVFTMHEVDKFGIREVVKRAVKAINPKLAHPIHVSFDIDSVDPLEAGSTGTKVLGGLTYREARFLLEQVVETGKFNSMDLVEINPIETPFYITCSVGDYYKPMNTTVALGIELILTALGRHLF